MEIYDYTPCEICAAEVPMDKTLCIACKSQLMKYVVDFQEETDTDMTDFADFLMNEQFKAKVKDKGYHYKKKYPELG